MKRKKLKTELEIVEDREFLKQWNEKMKAMQEDERQEIMDIRNRAKNLQNYHKFQMEIRRKNAEEDFHTNLENAFKTKLMLQNEQDEFLKYAEGWIDEYYKDGKDITPLLLDLKSYKKKMFSS